MKKQIILGSIVTLLVATFIATSAIGADDVIGNEVVGTKDKTLIRSGTGTTVSPYKLSLNLKNANIWTGAQTFKANTNFPKGIWNSIGNVGIGTTSPEVKLQVSGAAFLTNVESPSNGVGTRIGFDPGQFDGHPLGFVQAFNFEANVYEDFEVSGQNVWIATGQNVEDYKKAVYITSAGNVGIGTTSPWEKMHIKGGHAVFQSDLVSDSIDMQFYDADDTIGNYKWDLTYRGNNGGGNPEEVDDLCIYRNLGDGIGLFVMAWDYDTGNVGIGTTSPGQRLHVSGGGLGMDNNQFICWKNAADSFSARMILDTADVLKIIPYLGGVDIRNSADNASLLFVKDSDGKVGIGTTSPSYRLHVDGDIAYTGNIYDVSDLRLKENIDPIENAVEKVSSINGIYFNYKGESAEKREVGVIAQDVEKVLPEVVSEDAEGYKSVDYSKLTPLLIEAIKALKAENEALKVELKKQNEDFGRRIEALESK
ncbi:MAG: tail fiber domain-containing protein [bacterium]